MEGFNIHANTYVAKQARVHLEKLCRYITRPAVCDARLKLLDDGRVRMAFKSVWSNGAVGKVFEPVDFIAKLVPLVVKPRINLLRYHGQFAANAAWRKEICPTSPTSPTLPSASSAESTDPVAARRRYSWAELLRRCFAVDVLACKCGGRLELLSLIQNGAVARKILDHLDLPSELPRFRPARGPPGSWRTADDGQYSLGHELNDCAA